jgi:predicted DNA-binding protein (UPF0251 family)
MNNRSYYMSPRPKRLRKISDPPVISGFKPYGAKNGQTKSGDIFLHFEEYEALRLCDYELLNHNQASVIMNVSRPTLTRIYGSARQKIAEALVQGKQIIIEGGKIYFDSEWFSCKSCLCYFNNPDKQEEVKKCPLCGSSTISNCQELFYEPEEPEESVSRCLDICVCPQCGYEQPHRFGVPCRIEICPGCGHIMLKKAIPQNRKITKEKKDENSNYKYRKQFG